MKYKCVCGNIESEEVFDAFIDEQNIVTIAECLKCGKKYSKYYELKEVNEW